MKKITISIIILYITISINAQITIYSNKVEFYEQYENINGWLFKKTTNILSEFYIKNSYFIHTTNTHKDIYHVLEIDSSTNTHIYITKSDIDKIVLITTSDNYISLTFENKENKLILSKWYIYSIKD